MINGIAGSVGGRGKGEVVTGGDHLTLNARVEQTLVFREGGQALNWVLEGRRGRTVVFQTWRQGDRSTLTSQGRGQWRGRGGRRYKRGPDPCYRRGSHHGPTLHLSCTQNHKRPTFRFQQKLRVTLNLVNTQTTIECKVYNKSRAAQHPVRVILFLMIINIGVCIIFSQVTCRCTTPVANVAVNVLKDEQQVGQ